MTVCLTFIENDEEFIKGTYNGIEIYIRKSDGFINVTKMCDEGGRDFRTFKRSQRFKKIIQYYNDFECCANLHTPIIYELRNGFHDMQGQYLTPDLIHFVAEWISIEYSFKVKHIMDSINDKVHEVLNEKQLPDTPENAKPVFIEVAKQIAPSINQEFLENQCWGCRDSIKTLDQWEQDDLKRDIREYKEIKKRLEEVERKVDSWGLFLKQYHPEFEK